MVSKIEIIAYYVSLALNMYFVVTLGVQLQLTLEDGAALFVAIVLVFMDVATMRSYFATDERSGTRSIHLYYMATTKIEAYLLVLLGFFFVIIRASVLNIVLSVVDYVVVNLRIVLRFRAFAASEKYDARAINLRENAFPINLLFYIAVLAVDVVRGVCFLPWTIYRSLVALWTAQWLPEMADDLIEAPGAVAQAFF